MAGSCQVSLAIFVDALLAAHPLKVLHPCVGPLRHPTCVWVHTKLGEELILSISSIIACLWLTFIYLSSIGELFAVFPNKRRLHGVLQIPARGFIEVFPLWCLLQLFSYTSRYLLTHSQMSCPMVIPSAALFLLRLGDVSTSTWPLLIFSHWNIYFSSAVSRYWIDFSTRCTKR